MHGVLWENDNYVNNCRGCRVQFTRIVRRHHCRGCGGIFCESCSVTNANIRGEIFARACNGCIRGETPGEIIKKKTESAIGSHAIDKCRNLAEMIPLSRGTKYDKPDNTPAPLQGYFEFLNKSGAACCVKVLVGGTDTMWETPRPSFLCVGPNDAVNGTVDSGIPFIDLILLTNNLSSPPSESSISMDSLQGVAAWAQVDKFRDFSIYRIPCKDKNVLLKYKGGGVVEIRVGGSISRVGFVGMLTGSVPSGQIDFSTNISSMEKIFSSSGDV